MIQHIKYIVLTIMFSLSSIANANASEVLFGPSDVTVNKSDEFTINIVGTGFAELAGGDNIGLEFDGTLIEVIGVTIDPYFDFDPISGNRSSFNKWEGIAFDTFVNDPASSNFTIAMITLKALETGVSSLTFIDNANYFSTTTLLSPNLGAAEITVNAIPLPPAIFLLGSGLIGLFSFTRKKGN